MTNNHHEFLNFKFKVVILLTWSPSLGHNLKADTQFHLISKVNREELELGFIWLEAPTRHSSICRQLGDGGLQFKKALDNTDADRFETPSPR